MGRSDLEALFLRQIKNFKLPIPEDEFRFFAKRKWRFDFCWPDIKVAAEIEGGTFARGRHTRGAGFSEDCSKYNVAQFLGFQVYRFTGDMVQSGHACRFMKQVLEQEYSIFVKPKNAKVQ